MAVCLSEYTNVPLANSTLRLSLYFFVILLFAILCLANSCSRSVSYLMFIECVSSSCSVSISRLFTHFYPTLLLCFWWFQLLARDKPLLSFVLFNRRPLSPKLLFVCTIFNPKFCSIRTRKVSALSSILARPKKKRVWCFQMFIVFFFKKTGRRSSRNVCMWENNQYRTL